MDQVQAGGLQAGEGHVQGRVLNVDPGQGKGPVVPSLGGPVQGTAAGVAQAHHPGDLVKALPCRVVPGAPQDGHVGVPLDIYNQRSPPGHAQADEGGLQVRVGDVVGGDVPPHMVDRDQRHPQGIGHRLGKAHPHQHRANEPRGIGDGNAVHILPLQPRPDQGLVRQAVNGLDVLTGRNFRHHAPVNPVQIHLGGDAVCENPPSVLHQGHSGLVAGGFHGHQYHKSHSFRRISPSSLGDR